MTHLRADEALTLIEFLDQLRDVLMHTYGDEVKAMLQQASQREPGDRGDDEAF